MSGHRPFAELKKGWNPERRAANAARKAELRAEVLNLEGLGDRLDVTREAGRRQA